MIRIEIKSDPLTKALLFASTTCLAVIAFNGLGVALRADAQQVPSQPPKSTADGVATDDFVFPELRARSLVIEDDKGRSRIELKASDDGATIYFFDDRGACKLAQYVEKDASGIQFNEKGKPISFLGIKGKGPEFWLADPTGPSRAIIGVNSDECMLVMGDKTKNRRITMGIGEKGPALFLFDETGRPRTWLDVTRSGPELMLTDGNKVRTHLRVNQAGPALMLFDQNENMRLALGAAESKTGGGKSVTYPENSLIFMGADGRKVKELP